MLFSALIAILLGIFGSVFSTYTGLYLAKDNDLLLSMPIPVQTIMFARLMGVYLMGLMYLAVVIVPAIGSIIWFAIFGGMGLSLTQTLGLDWAKEAGADISLTLFHVFEHYPLGKILSMVAIFLLFTFFITSANSGTFVLGMLSEEGRLQPTHRTMFIWGCIEAALSYALLLSGGMKSVQTISIAAAFPFIFIMCGSMLSILKALKKEHYEIYPDPNVVIHKDKKK